MNIADIFKGMNKAQLDAAVEKAKEFAVTEKGREIVNELKTTGTVKGLDKDAGKIIEEIKKNPELAKKISDIINGG